jgi:molecular chaperone DnaK
MAKAIGIDLGTTNSVAALKVLDTRIIPNAEGEELTPSVVCYQGRSGLLGRKRQFVVGRHALEWMQQDPSNTIVSIKRLMGRSFSDDDVQRLLQEGRYSYEVKSLESGSQQSIAVVLGDEEYTPEQISAKILDKIRQDCEAQLDDTVEQAVVTVPAYFNDKQKHATRIAAALGGLKVQRLLPEPTAAAISFGVDQLAEGEGQTILVFDLGGGTFDLSVLTIADGQFIEQGKGGDMWMGGDDIDDLIRKHVYRETETEYEVEDLTALVAALPDAERNRFLGDLKAKVEAAKVRLSSQPKAVIEILGMLKDADGDILDIEVEIDREHFETLLQPFVDRILELTRGVLDDIGFEPQLIDRVVMVGGSSSIPLVIREMQAYFGEEKVMLHERPMLAVAEGAAMLAHRLADTYECPACDATVAQSDAICPHCGFDLQASLVGKGVVDIVHTTSHDYFLELETGDDHLLVKRNTPLPYKTQESFRLIHAEQLLAHFRFYNMVNDNRESIGDLWLNFELEEELDEKNLPEVLLDFEIDVNNLITVSASLKEWPEIQVSRTLSRGKADERLFVELQQGIDQANQEKHDFFATIDYLRRMVKIAGLINRVIDPQTDEENPSLSKEAEQRLRVAREVLKGGQAPLANQYHAQSFLFQLGHLMPEKGRKRLEEKLKKFERLNETGTLRQIMDSRKQLLAEIDKYPELGILAEIIHAAETCRKEDPARVPRFDEYIRNISAAFQQQDATTAIRLIKEIMPEVQQIADQEEEKELHIWHGVQK